MNNHFSIKQAFGRSRPWAFVEGSRSSWSLVFLKVRLESSKINKIIYGLITGIILSGCATDRLYEGPPRDHMQIAVITSSISPDTRVLLDHAFDDTPPFLGSASTLHSVDGKEGARSNPVYHNVFNSEWDGSFRVEVLPGEHTLEVMPNINGDITKPEQTIHFVAEAGHEYFLGQIRTIKLSFTLIKQYKWRPVLVDQTVNRLVSPIQSSQSDKELNRP